MSSVIDVHADNWEETVLGSGTLTVVDFWHEQCLWCKRLKPVYNEVAEEYKNKVRFARLNALESQENQQIAIKHGVMSTPTLVFFCEGKPIETSVGFHPKERLKQLIDDVIGKHQECVKHSTKLKP